MARDRLWFTSPLLLALALVACTGEISSRADVGVFPDGHDEESPGDNRDDGGMDADATNGQEADGEASPWQSFGPGGGGWLWTVAVAPDTRGTVYVGCDVGGAYRSSDHGTSWTMINQGLGNHYVQAFAFDHTDPAVVYAGTLGGVYKSQDGGDRWTLKRTGFPPLELYAVSAPVAALAVNPADRLQIIAGLGHPRLREPPKNGGIYLSRDGAETWTKANGPASLSSAGVYSLTFHPGDPRIILAATTAGGFRSTDGGTTWMLSGEGMPAGSVMELAVDQHRVGTFYATWTNRETQSGGVAKSIDSGRTWAVVRTESGRDWEHWRLVADPSRADRLYTAARSGTGVYRSTNGGAGWTRITRDGNVTSAWFDRGFGCSGLAIDTLSPGRLYYVNDMEIYASDNHGETWTQVATEVVTPATATQPATWRGRGMETTCASAPVVVAPGHPAFLYLGYWDIGLWASLDGGATLRWSNQWMGFGKAAAVVIDPQRPWRAWLSFGPNTGPHRIWRTDDYGRDWKLVGVAATGLAEGALFHLVLDPTSPADSRTLLAAVDQLGIFESVDGGSTWQRVDNGLGANPRFTSLQLDPQDPSRVFAGVGWGGGVWRSGNGGRHWTLVADIPERPRIAIAPSDPAIVYVGERDYSGIGKGGVYRSTDGGDTWQLVALRLDDGFGSTARSYIQALAVDPDDPDHVYATSVDEGYDLSFGKGVFASEDGGINWHPLNQGLTSWNLSCLTIDPNDRARLYAGSGGNGFFRRNAWAPPSELPPPPSSALPRDPVTLTTDGWGASTEVLREFTVHNDSFWWGQGFVLARLDTTSAGAAVTKTFDPVHALGEASVVTLRLRGSTRDGSPLSISRIVLSDSAGGALTHEKDINITTTWTQVELPFDDFAGVGFDKNRVRSIRFDLWVPYAEGRPYELAVGGIRFR